MVSLCSALIQLSCWSQQLITFGSSFSLSYLGYIPNVPKSNWALDLTKGKLQPEVIPKLLQNVSSVVNIGIQLLTYFVNSVYIQWIEGYLN